MARKKAKKSGRDFGGMRHNPVKQNWIGYTGNKATLIDVILDLLPKHMSTFVDLFGGSGYVAASVWKDRRAEQIVVNDIEFEWARMLAWMAAATPDEVIAEYKAAKKQWFGEDSAISEENAYKWHELEDFYNARIIAWDSSAERQEDHRESVKKVDTIYNTSAYLMLLAKTSWYATPKFAEDGRRYSHSPNFMKFPDPEHMRPFLETWHEAYEADALRIYSHNFLDFNLKHREAKRPRPEKQVKGTKVETSQRFVDITNVFSNQRDFLDLVFQLDDKSVVYSDAPYLGSTASYTSKWSAADEIALLSLMDTLKQNGSHYLLSNNLRYNNPILASWTNSRSARRDNKHVWVLNKDYITMQARKKGLRAQSDRKGVEVLVADYPRSASRHKLSSALVEVPKDRDAYEFGVEVFGEQ